jgi:hypothetical protein
MVPGRYVSRGKIMFTSNATAWELMKRMKGQRFTCEVNGQTSTLWHGFDKGTEEQLMTRRVSMLVTALKEFFVGAGLAEAQSPADWWRKQLLDADYDQGSIWLKTGETREGFRTAHLVAKVVGEAITIQQDKLELVKAKANPHHERLQTVFAEAVQRANQLTSRSS